MDPETAPATTEAIEALRRENERAALRGPAFDAAWMDYEQETSDAYRDYQAESAAAWDRYQTRLKGITADHQGRVERIRSGDIPDMTPRGQHQAQPWQQKIQHELGEDETT